MYLSSNQPPWFAFLVHPRDHEEFLTMPGGSLLREYSDSDEEFVYKATSNPPVVCDDVVFMGSAVRGEIVGVPRLPESILTPDGNRAVVEAMNLGVQRGARVIGLGALTAPATAGGRALLRHLPQHVTLTNGNGLTAAVARRNVLEAAEWSPATGKARVAILGATGSVGQAVSHLLADDGFELILIGPTCERVERLLGDLLDRAVVGRGMAGAAEADIVLSLTNSPSAAIAPKVMRAGAIVIDIAQPHNVDDERVAAFADRDIVVARGGVVRIPGYSCARDFRLVSKRDSFACLAETYLLACEGIREHSVGRPSPTYAKRMDQLAVHHGVVACPLEPVATPTAEIRAPQPMPAGRHIDIGGTRA
jgi:fatty aldehyde-generating acyl-ACP reductase